MGGEEGLLLVAHGSGRYADSARVLLGHAAVLRESGRFVAVEVGLLNGAPSVAEALGRIAAPVVRVVPFFMEAGYFVRVAVPGALGGDARVVMCAPVGTHDGLAAVAEGQALRACAGLGVAADRAAVVVVGHGSARAPGRAAALSRCAGLVAACGRFGRVAVACLEEAPLLGDVLAGLRGWAAVAVVGFFAGEGTHVLDDVPGAVAAEVAVRGGGVVFAGCVTDDPGVVEIIAERAGGGG
jgi:sirohydrochlorin cobaltochelatase